MTDLTFQTNCVTTQKRNETQRDQSTGEEVEKKRLRTKKVSLVLGWKGNFFVHTLRLEPVTNQGTYRVLGLPRLRDVCLLLVLKERRTYRSSRLHVSWTTDGANDGVFPLRRRPSLPSVFGLPSSRLFTCPLFFWDYCGNSGVGVEVDRSE